MNPSSHALYRVGTAVWVASLAACMWSGAMDIDARRDGGPDARRREAGFTPADDDAGDPGACVPDCVGRLCGPDNCGGSCGGCLAGATCDVVRGTCRADPCAELTACGACLGDARCGWCAARGACVSGGAEGSTDGECRGAQWVSDAAQCGGGVVLDAGVARDSGTRRDAAPPSTPDATRNDVVSTGCPGGVTASWTCRDARTMQRCVAGRVETRTCASSCQARAGDAVCACPAGTYPIWTCTADERARQRCEADGTVRTETCASGQRCERRPVGTDDVCVATPACPAGVGASWTCVPGVAARQRCVAGRVERESCGAGCIAQGSADALCVASVRTPGCCAPPVWRCSPLHTSRSRCVDDRGQTESCGVLDSACRDGTLVTDSTCGATPPPACAAGLNPFWTCASDGVTLRRCVDGRSESLSCAGRGGCVRLATGVNDVCANGLTPCCPTDQNRLWTCAPDGRALTRCNAAGYVDVQRCGAAGCAVRGAGLDDACR